MDATKGDVWEAVLEYLLSAARRNGTALNLYRRAVALRGQIAAATAERDDARAEVETLRAEAALLREKLAAATTRVEELEESTAMACQSPADGCDCAGCLYAAERERADLAATLETRTAEHALAVARVAELEAIIAGRSKPPTNAELVAMEAAGLRLARRWHAVDKAGTVRPFPTAEVSRG